MRELFSDNLKVSRLAKPLLIVSVVLLIISLAGLIAARNLPTEVEQELTLLNYEHEGRFDYLVHLKPSYLFGPPPPEEPPPNPKYPAAIVDTIDFRFKYSPVEKGTEVASVDAILEDPDIWQKKIKLVPYTNTNGDFSLRFSLDIDWINDLFDDIEEEIEITQSPRNLSIKAYVTSPKERFIQSLPIELSDTLIEVDSNLRHTQVCGVGQFDYVVNLKENSIFETTTVTSPPPVPVITSSKTLKPGEVVFSRLIDSMDVTFYYRFKSDRPANEVTTEVVATTFLEATMTEEMEAEAGVPKVTKLWTKKFPILHAREDEDFNISFPLDFVYYTDLMETIRTETGATAGSYSLTVTADVHTVAETQFASIDEVFTHSLVGTLERGIVDWGEEFTKTEPGSIKETTLIPNPNKYWGLSVSGACYLSAALVSVFFIIFLFSLALYIRFKPAGLTPVEREALRVGKKYRERMAEATSQEGGKIVSLGSVEDLTKVADELAKPIIHQAPSTAGECHAYYVFDGVTQYQYLLTLGSEEQADEAGEAGYRRSVKKLIEEEIRKAREKDARAEDGHFQT